MSATSSCDRPTADHEAEHPQHPQLSSTSTVTRKPEGACWVGEVGFYAERRGADGLPFGPILTADLDSFKGASSGDPMFVIKANGFESGDLDQKKGGMDVSNAGRLRD